MAEQGEWAQKGATLTDGTAFKEYGVDRDFIVRGIRAGKLEYREASIYGNPAIRVLRSQLEQYITEEQGAAHLRDKKIQAELKKIKREIGSLKRKLSALEARKAEIEGAITEAASEQHSTGEAL